MRDLEHAATRRRTESRAQEWRCCHEITQIVVHLQLSTIRPRTSRSSTRGATTFTLTLRTRTYARQVTATRMMGTTPMMTMSGRLAPWTRRSRVPRSGRLQRRCGNGGGDWLPFQRGGCGCRAQRPLQTRATTTNGCYGSCGSPVNLVTELTVNFTHSITTIRVRTGPTIHSLVSVRFASG